MPDPIDELRSLARGAAPVRALPAAEVRRRGDRLRRRNAAAATLAGVAAATAAVALPFAVAGGGDRTGSPPVATGGPSPTETVAPQRVPAALDLTAGIAGSDTAYRAREDADPELTAVVLCGRPAWTADAGTVDVLGATYEGEGSENFTHRTLAVYPDDATAQRALEAVEAAVTSCPTARVNDGTTVENAPADQRLRGDDSLVFTQRYRFDGEGHPNGELDVWQVVRTGNAVLLTRTYGAGAGADPALVRAEVRREGEQVEPVLADLERHFG